MTNLSKPWAAVLVLCGALALSASTASAQQLELRAVSTDVSVQGNAAQATFKIEVVNKEASPVTNLFVVFDDGTTATIGDVDANSTVVSELQTRIIDLGDGPHSKSIPMSVTLKFTFNGETVEKTWALVLMTQ